MLYLYLLKVDHDASFGTTWNIPNLNFQPKNNSSIMMAIKILFITRKTGIYLIRLESHLNGLKLGYQGHL